MQWAYLRGVLLVAFLWGLLSFFSSELLWPLLGTTPPVENFDQVPLFPLIPILVAISLVVYIDPQRRTLLLGLALGGILANTFGSHLFSPVADYLPIPGSDGYYANLADVGILLGPILYLFLHLRDWLKEERYALSKLRSSRQECLTLDTGPSRVDGQES
jgi:hypothetical protein